MIFRLELEDSWYLELQPKDVAVEIGTGVKDSGRRSSVVGLHPWEARALAGALEALATAIECEPKKGE